jgi:hypothetical protein
MAPYGFTIEHLVATARAVLANHRPAAPGGSV